MPRYNFKNSDMVKCRIIRNTKFAGQPVSVGTIVEVQGILAKQSLGGCVPSMELVEGAEPRPLIAKTTEIIIETPDPVVETRDPEVAKTGAKKKVTRSKPPAKPESYDDNENGV